MARPDPERVWLGFAQAALGGAMSINVEIDPLSTNWEKENARLCDDVAAMADSMLERWRLRYDDDEIAPKTTPGVQPEPAPTKPAIDW